MARDRHLHSEAAPEAPRWIAGALGVVLLAVQIVVVPSATAPFRSPKQLLALGGLAAVTALGAMAMLRRRSLALPRHPLAAVLAALPILQAASALWSGDPRLALQAALSSAVWVAAVLLIAALDYASRERLLLWCSAGAAISAVVMLLQAAGLPLIAVARVYGRFRLTGLAGNPVDLSLGCVLLLPLLLAQRPGARRSWWRWALAVVLAATPVVTKTLTGLVALVAVVGVWLLLNRSWRRWAAAGLAMAVVVVAALALSGGPLGRVTGAFRDLRHGNWYALTSARGDGWTAAAEMIRTRPLGGVGAGNFTHAFYPSRLAWLERTRSVGGRGELATHFQWAHCDPLQHLAELGAAGAAWLVALAWALALILRREPALLALATAAVAPFLLMQYPTHLAVGMVPIALLIARPLADQPRLELAPRTPTARRLAGLALLAIAVVGPVWQLRALSTDLWQARLERGVAAAQAAADGRLRSQLATAVELAAMSAIDRRPGAAGWLWRVIGKARLARAESRGAESAFRTAGELWPHEEAEFGLGLALAAQGRRNEALVHLGRVCRVNPALARLIQSPDLRQAVEDLEAARKR